MWPVEGEDDEQDDGQVQEEEHQADQKAAPGAVSFFHLNALNASPRLRQMDKNLVDAAQDLGCTWMQAFWKVILPEIKPGIVSGGEGSGGGGDHRGQEAHQQGHVEALHDEPVLEELPVPVR